MKYWTPGRNVAVDELMERYNGPSYATVTIPSKPTPTGFKAWGIAEKGYLLNWIFHRRKKSPVAAYNGKKTTNPKVPMELGMNKTAAVVPFLLESLPKLKKGLQYHVWLDNLFVSTKLLCYLRVLGYDAAGTANAKSGIIVHLINLKKEDKRRDFIIWGSLIQAPTIDGLIMQSAWKDNAVVLYMSNTY